MANKAIVKTWVDGIVVALATAVGSFIAFHGKISDVGNTIIGVSALALAGGWPVLRKWFDKNDPAFGRVLDVAAPYVEKALEAKTGLPAEALAGIAPEVKPNA